MEVWKDIDGYEGYYQVSNLGSVKSLERYVNIGNGGRLKVKERILASGLDKRGYPIVSLFKNNHGEIKTIHRLVASAFIPNEQNKPTVNHKDEIKTNNTVENLEWATQKENTNYGTGIERSIASRKANPLAGAKRWKRVDQYDLYGRLVKSWPSVKSAATHYGIDGSMISRCCRGVTKRAINYIWKYSEASSNKEAG